MTQYTAFLISAYVFITMQIDTRKIVHVNVATNRGTANSLRCQCLVVFSTPAGWWRRLTFAS